MLDAAVVTIMCSLEREDDALHYIQLLNPDVIRNHYFLNLCYEEREELLKDWGRYGSIEVAYVEFEDGERMSASVCQLDEVTEERMPRHVQHVRYVSKTGRCRKEEQRCQFTSCFLSATGTKI